MHLLELLQQQEIEFDEEKEAGSVKMRLASAYGKKIDVIAEHIKHLDVLALLPKIEDQKQNAQDQQIIRKMMPDMFDMIERDRQYYYLSAHMNSIEINIGIIMDRLGLPVPSILKPFIGKLKYLTLNKAHMFSGILQSKNFANDKGYYKYEIKGNEVKISDRLYIDADTYEVVLLTSVFRPSCNFSDMGSVVHEQSCMLGGVELRDLTESRSILEMGMTEDEKASVACLFDEKDYDVSGFKIGQRYVFNKDYMNTINRYYGHFFQAGPWYDHIPRGFAKSEMLVPKCPCRNHVSKVAYTNCICYGEIMKTRFYSNLESYDQIKTARIHIERGERDRNYVYYTFDLNVGQECIWDKINFKFEKNHDNYKMIVIPEAQDKDEFDICRSDSKTWLGVMGLLTFDREHVTYDISFSLLNFEVPRVFKTQVEIAQATGQGRSCYYIGLNYETAYIIDLFEWDHKVKSVSYGKVQKLLYEDTKKRSVCTTTSVMKQLITHGIDITKIRFARCVNDIVGFFYADLLFSGRCFSSLQVRDTWPRFHLYTPVHRIYSERAPLWFYVFVQEAAKVCELWFDQSIVDKIWMYMEFFLPQPDKMINELYGMEYAPRCDCDYRYRYHEQCRDLQYVGMKILTVDGNKNIPKLEDDYFDKQLKPSWEFYREVVIDEVHGGEVSYFSGPDKVDTDTME